ncbi:MAG: putative acetyltransferase [Lentisphaerae bacterium ADurb.Bin242]|nr:MAG: putative acetyltransferase [Lentisphaerae bacterium ADurb.Bin242]
MSVTVRNFEERDAERVARIMFESFKTFLGDRIKEPETPDYWIQCSTRDFAHSVTRSFVAESDGKVIGYLCATANTKNGLGTLNVIGVDPACFAQGCGSALFAAADAFWRGLGMRKIYTCTSHVNLRAQAYYKKMGFVEEGRLKDHFHEGIDEIQLSKFMKKG